MKASNSAAQVSTRLKTGWTPAAQRAARAASSVVRARDAMRLSAKPMRFASRQASASGGSPRASTGSWSTMPFISRRNQGSMEVRR